MCSYYFFVESPVCLASQAQVIKVFTCHGFVSGFDKHSSQGYIVKEMIPLFSINVEHVL